MANSKMVESLPCRMTADEVALKSGQMAATLDDMGKLESKKKSVTTELAEDIKQARTRLDHLGTEVRTGIEYRPTECYEVPRYRDLKVDLVRDDTGEVVRTRPMHPNERQEALALGNDDAREAVREH